MAILRTQGTLGDFLGDVPWPIAFFKPKSLPGFLDKIHVVDHTMRALDGGFVAEIALAVDGEASLGIPGLDGAEFVVGGDQNLPGLTQFSAIWRFGNDSSLSLTDIRLALRFSAGLLKPVDENGDVIPNAKPEIFVTGSVGINSSFDLDVSGFDALTLDPVMIGDSGVIISASGVKLDLSRTSTIPEVEEAGFDDSFMGVFIGEAALRFPDGMASAVPSDLVLSKAAIGTGGVSGVLAASYDPPFEGELFGMTYSLESLAITVKQNAFVQFRLTGMLTIPFFEAPLEVDVSLAGNGRFSIQMTTADEKGFKTISKKDVFSLRLDSIGFEIEHGVFLAKVSGKLTPTLPLPGVTWPSFDLEELSIDSKGNVRLEGGWLDLPKKEDLPFYGLLMELKQIAFGKTDLGENLIGLSGDVALPGGLAGGGSVKGLRIYWDDNGNTRLTIEGVKVHLEIPDTLRFSGELVFREYLDIDSGLPVRRFDSRLKLELLALGIVVDGTLVIGTVKDGARTERFMALYLAGEFSSGIPLFSTGVGLYGLSALLALNFEPNKTGAEVWYSGDGTDSWFHRPEVGISDLINKWDFESGSKAFGAGATLGTISDNGFAFNARILLVIVFPGPILLLEGRANVMKERATLSAEPQFRAVAILDVPAGEFLFGLDAHYRFKDTGELIDISANVEAFFSLNDPTKWHVYLGKKSPLSSRVRVHALQLFQANAYFMVDAKRVQTGVWIGWGKSWKFGPLGVTLEAWLDSNVAVSWQPAHFTGSIWLHGKAELAAFGIGLGITLDALIAAEVFDPFHLLACLSVSLELPWPLKDISVEFKLEWGPKAVWPALPLPLKEVAIGHFKTGVSWPLERDVLLFPNYDKGGGILDEDQDGSSFDPDAAPLTVVPVVPVDCRPRITFARPIHDDAFVGISVHPVDPAVDVIGDPATGKGAARLRFSLERVAIERWDGDTWELVADAKNSTNPPVGPGRLFGSWAPVPALAGGDESVVSQTKLWLFSKNTYDYTLQTSGGWSDSFSEEFPGFPCVPINRCLRPIPPELIVPPAGGEFAHPDHEQLRFRIPLGVTAEVAERRGLPRPFQEVLRVTRDAAPDGRLHELLTIDLGSEPNRGASLTIVSEGGVRVFGENRAGAVFGPFEGGTLRDTGIDIDEPNLTLLHVHSFTGTFDLVLVCFLDGMTEKQIEDAEEMNAHLAQSLTRWQDEGFVFLPDSDYRIKIVTKVKATRTGEVDLPAKGPFKQVEYASFRTQGPPRLANLSLPPGAQSDANNTLLDENGELIDVFGRASSVEVLKSELNDLTLYVEQTLPPTVPPPGEPPLLPKPVYRAYDVGVVFNVDYVSLMYLLKRRDLGLQLFDANDQPVRDPSGRIVVLGMEFGKVTQITEVDEPTAWWIESVNASKCVSGPPLEAILPEETKVGGYVLEPDALYEARLVPLLLHETFETYGDVSVSDGEILGDWTVVDQGANGPSQWTTVEDGTTVTQTTGIGTDSGPNDPVKPGTMLVRVDSPNVDPTHPDQPSKWIDYRLSLLLVNPDENALGVVFRYQGPQDYYRFSLDRKGAYLRLVRVLSGVHRVLGEDEFVFESNRLYRVAVEVLGGSLRVFLDGLIVFDVVDPTFQTGSVGLYCWRSAGPTFSDVRVEDFRPEAAVAYRFPFTAGLYATFFHQIHAYQDESWSVALEGVDLSAELLAAVPLTDEPSPPSDDEARAYEKLAEATDELAALTGRVPPRLEATTIEVDGAVVTTLLLGPEPIDWARVTLEVEAAPLDPFAHDVPNQRKLAEATPGALLPPAESVTVLVREPATMQGAEIQHRFLGTPVAPSPATGFLFSDFFDRNAGRLFREDFGPNALDAYEILDETAPPSDWQSDALRIVQTVRTPPTSGAAGDLEKQGTLALVGDPSWTDLRVRATLLSSVDEGDFGLVLRYQDEDNYYRFSWSKEFSYRRFVVNAAGVFTVLFEDGVAFEKDRSYELEIVAFGDRILGYVDGALLFHLLDASHTAGRIGLYAWSHAGATFEALAVESVGVDPLVAEIVPDELEAFHDAEAEGVPAVPSEWEPTEFVTFTYFDAAGAIEGPSQWEVQNGEIVQVSSIHVDNPPDEEFPGTHLIGGPLLVDFELDVELQSDDVGAIGVILRYLGEDDYLRFSMDARPEFNYRRLIKKVGGTVTTLWEVLGESFTVGERKTLTVRAVGTSLRGSLGGEPLFDIEDADLTSGRIGFYTRRNVGARFAAIRLIDVTPALGSWEVFDAGNQSGPSDWRIAAGALQQSSEVAGGAGAFEKLGTQAVAGDASWTDYRLVARARSDDDDAVGIVFRYVDELNYYRFSVENTDPYQRLVKFEAGVASVLFEALTPGFVTGQPFTLAADVVGDRIVGYLDGERIFDVVDGTHPAGQVGLYTSSNPGARFEWVEVRPLGLEARALFRDLFPAGNNDGWLAKDEGTIDAPSNWLVTGGEVVQTSAIGSGETVPPDAPEKFGTHYVAGDPSWTDYVFTVRLRSEEEDAIGVVFRYQGVGDYYLFTMDRARAYRQLNKRVGGVFTVLWQDAFLYEPGRPYSLAFVLEGDQLRGHLDGVPMFTVTDPDLTAGQIGLYTWKNSDAHFSEVRVLSLGEVTVPNLFEDEFDVEVPDQWEFLDEGDVDGPSVWQVQDGEMQQTSSISDSGLPNQPQKPGTQAVAGSEEWTDYRASIWLRTESAGDAIGAVFRFVGIGESYYRFSMDATQNYRRLIKKVDGTVTTIWEDLASSYLIDRDYVLAVECVGERIRVYLDGALLVEVFDDALTAGRVGLYCWNNPGARFARVEVSEPVWLTYKTFGEGESLPAGTRVRVFSGPESAGPPAEIGTEDHFVADQDEGGDVHLGQGAVDLRLRDPLGVISHVRRFWSNETFQAQARKPKVLRKADGTGFFWVPDPLGPLPPAIYRLRFRYRRDAGTDLPVFSQEGDTGDEVAVIDVPWTRLT